LLLAQAAAETQRKGKPGQLVDPRPETVDGGEIKIRITPQLVHDIFDEYPVVAKAYNDNVPNKVCYFISSVGSWLNLNVKLSEEEFWKRYFQSKLFNAHRASIRSSATQHVVKDDPIFDKYLEKEDDGTFIYQPISWRDLCPLPSSEMEPRRQRNESVDVFVDLAATQEDHGEVSAKLLTCS
jgi:transcription initiation factor TFIIH subunit 1